VAASAWNFYYLAKKHMMDGTIDLDTDTFRMTLHTSASNAISVANLTVIGSVTGQLADGAGYSTSGKNLAAVTWGVGASASEMRFDSTAVTWTATGGDLTNIKYAVISKVGTSAGGHKLLMYSQLSTSQFTVTSGNTLTVTPSANGYFELN
jgi:hypothetical protein